MIAAGLSVFSVQCRRRVTPQSRPINGTASHSMSERKALDAAKAAEGPDSPWNSLKPSSWGMHYSRHHADLPSLWEEYRRLSRFSSATASIDS